MQIVPLEMLLVTAACASQFAAFHGSIHLGSFLQIRRFESLEELEHLQPDWEQLLAQIPTASIFNTWEWLVPWWRAYGAKRRLMVLGFFRGDGKLVGLAPLSLIDREVVPGIRLRVLEFMGDGSEDSDNLDLLAIPGQEPDVIRCLLAYLREHESSWNVAQFNTLPSNSLTGEQILLQLGEEKWPFAHSRQPWSFIELPLDWKSYLAKISKKEAEKLAYYQRRIERRYQTRFFKCTDEGELDKCLGALFDLHQKRWQGLGERGSFGLPARRAFYADMARAFLARNWLQFWVLELNGEILAAQFTFRYRDTVYALQEGFEPAYASDSIGFVLRGVALRRLIEEGVRRYDFLMGQNPSKERWGAQTESYQSIHFARPFSLGSTYLQTREAAHSSKEWLRGHIPARAWTALQLLHRKLGHPADQTSLLMSADSPAQRDMEKGEKNLDSGRSQTSPKC